jgi:Cu+-exporting ATPase
VDYNLNITLILISINSNVVPLIITQVDAVVFDKTGTLTLGKPSVTQSMLFVNDMTVTQFWTLVGRAESGSEHPLGRALLDFARAETNFSGGCDGFEALSGRGLRCTVDGVPVVIGNAALMEENKCSVSDGIQHALASAQAQGHTAMLVGAGQRVLGMVAVADPIRPETTAVVAQLKRRGIAVWMLTGDSTRTAQAIARQADIDNVFAQVLPKDKSDKVRELQVAGRVVAMVGDGINDSPALAQANVGIAIGGGTDIAMEAAAVVLLKADLRDVLVAMDLSSATFNRIRLNFLLAFGYNLIALPFATGVFFPLIKAAIPPWAAGLAMACSSVTVVTSSLFLRRYKPPAWRDELLVDGHPTLLDSSSERTPLLAFHSHGRKLVPTTQKIAMGSVNASSGLRVRAEF